MIRKHALPILIAVILTTLIVFYLSRVEVPDCRLAKKGFCEKVLDYLERDEKRELDRITFLNRREK